MCCGLPSNYCTALQEQCRVGALTDVTELPTAVREEVRQLREEVR
jgi:hypothetical protein